MHETEYVVETMLGQNHEVDGWHLYEVFPDVELLVALWLKG